MCAEPLQIPPKHHVKAKQVIFISFGLVILLLACLGLSLTPLRVQVDGWELELIRVITPSPTPTPEPTPSTTPASSLTPSSSALENGGTNLYIVTDPSWKFSPTATGSWEQVRYDDSAWQPVESTELCPAIPGVEAHCLWDYPYVYTANATLYFRKTFNLSTVPPHARLVALADDDIDVFLNGRQVLGDSYGGISWWEIDVTGMLQTGENVLVLRGVDTGEGTAYVEAALGACFDGVDHYPPLISIMNRPTEWFNGDVYLEAVDAPCDTGILELAYQVDGGPWQIVQPHQHFTLPPGEHDVLARATDRAGRQSLDLWHFFVRAP